VGHQTAAKRAKIHINFICDQGGSHRSRVAPADRKRATSTKKTNCPFSFVAVRNPGDKSWSFGDDYCLRHNHPRLEELSGAARARQLQQPESRLAMTAYVNAGLPPRKVVALLRTPGLRTNDPGAVNVIAKDVYNHQARLRRREAAGRNPMQELIDMLGEAEGVYFNVRKEHGPTGESATGVFFAFRESISMLCTYANTIQADATYKTNRHAHVLLHFVALCATGKSFSAAFAFLPSEKQEDYAWALRQFVDLLGPRRHCLPAVIVTDRDQAFANAIKEVLPWATHLLCLWHIHMNVVANCKKHFKEIAEWEAFMREWQSLCESDSEEAFERAWENFRAFCDERYRLAFQYIERTWITPWKKAFILAWVGFVKHYNQRTTSKVEGMHAAIKEAIRRATGDFLKVAKTLLLEAINRDKDIRAVTQQQMTKSRVGPDAAALATFLEPGEECKISMLARKLFLGELGHCDLRGADATADELLVLHTQAVTIQAVDGVLSEFSASALDAAAEVGAAAAAAALMVDDEADAALQPVVRPLCGCAKSCLMWVTGIPCAAFVRRTMQERKLKASDFDMQWHLGRTFTKQAPNITHTMVSNQQAGEQVVAELNQLPPDESREVRNRIQALLDQGFEAQIYPEPAPANPRGRPQGSMGRVGESQAARRAAHAAQVLADSTRRDASQFERVLTAETATQPRTAAPRVVRCTQCKQPGHNIRTCPGPAPAEPGAGTQPSQLTH
jgi:hypothetical protein